MTQIEREIVDRVSKLNPMTQQQVLDYVRQLQSDEADELPLTLREWLDKARTLRQELHAKYGDNYLIDIQSMLEEVREERSNDLMGGR